MSDELKNKSKKDLREFAAILIVVCVVLSALWIRKGSQNAHFVFIAAAGYALLSLVFYPDAIRPVYIVLTRVAHAIGWFNTRLFLSLLFYFVLTPIGLLLRIFGKDLLKTKVKGDEKTYWIPREEKPFDPKQYENQF